LGATFVAVALHAVAPAAAELGVVQSNPGAALRLPHSNTARLARGFGSASVLLTTQPATNPLPGCLHEPVVDEPDGLEAPAAGQERPEVLRLPASPDSRTLFWWALSSLGAWQLGRYSRKLHFASLPEWYHAGGPVQIGQSQRWDLQRPMGDVALWYWPVPATTGQPRLRIVVHDSEDIRSFFRSLSPAAPRGPP